MRSKKPSLSALLVEVIQRHRLQKKMSRQALAEKAGLHQTAVGLVERGLRTPSVETVQALAAALELPLSQLVREAEDELSAR